jgi:hypothetical protein
VKDGGLSATWSDVNHNVASFQLNGRRVGALLNDGTLLAKEGDLDAPWSSLQGNVVSFQIDGNRVGVLQKDGVLRVKDGGLNATWADLDHNVAAFQLNGNRIGILKLDGSLFVKEGSLNAEWVDEQGIFRSFQLDGNRIGGLKNDASLLVKEEVDDSPFVIAPGHFREEQHGSDLYRYYRTVELWSGHGSDKSDWYEIASGPVPDGFRIATAAFWLVGDRSCQGDEVNKRPKCGWCECQEKQFGPKRVIWKFRMQGHSERARLMFDRFIFDSEHKRYGIQFRMEGDAATSVGILVVRFTPV